MYSVTSVSVSASQNVGKYQSIHSSDQHTYVTKMVAAPLDAERSTYAVDLHVAVLAEAKAVRYVRERVLSRASVNISQ